MPEVFLASRNAKKLAEMRRILAQHVPDVVVLGLDDVPPYDEPVEDQPTFEGNALVKARAGVAATGKPSIADDSGLCVDALNGMPGVLSARWSGDLVADRIVDELNNELLLAQLGDVPQERRGAHFACAVALCLPGGEEHVVHGRMDGRILTEARGAGGFGYDPLFVADEHAAEGLTSAELDPAEKDRISHRGRALRALAPVAARVLTGNTFSFSRLHHVQLAIPPGGEEQCRAFWGGVLGLGEVEKPPVLAARGGCWFRGGGLEVHLGVEPEFAAARKAHPGILVANLRVLAQALEAAGVEVTWDDDFPGHDRFYAADPFGNRLEFLEVS